MFDVKFSLEFEKPPIVLFDVDGPFARFDQALLERVRPGTTEDEIRALGDWDIFKILTEEEYAEAEKVMEDPEFWRTLPCRPESKAEYARFIETGAEVIFVTAPWIPCKQWEWARRQWLLEHFGLDPRKDREKLIVAGRKDVVFGTMFVDDKPSTVRAWQKAWGQFGCQAFLFETLNNEGDDFYPRIRPKDEGWTIVYDKAEDE